MDEHKTDYYFGDINLKNVHSEKTLNTICPLLVGVAGGSASGKTTLCNKIISSLGLRKCLVVSFDSFYKTPPKGTDFAQYNFDHPDAIDFDACYEVLKQLVLRQEAEMPQYSFKEHRRLEETVKAVPTDLILIEGILAFHDPRIVALMNLRIFVSCDDDIRLYRRVQRDVNERGRDVSGILYQYNKFVKPAFEQFIRPSMKHANIIVPGSSDNQVAINFIVQNLRSQLAKLEDFKASMKKNFYLSDILDSIWLNIITDGEQRNPEEMGLYMADQILFLRDQSTKTECIQLFNLFAAHDQFSKTLYSLVIVRFLTYAVKMMKRYNVNTPGNAYGIVHINSETHDEINESAEVLSLIVPFLYDKTEKEVTDKINAVLSKYPNIKKVFVLAIFSNIHSMTALVKSNPKIYIVNIMCIVDMEVLLKLLTSNCKVKDFDFVKNEEVIELLMSTTKRELARKEKQ